MHTNTFLLRPGMGMTAHQFAAVQAQNLQPLLHQNGHYHRSLARFAARERSLIQQRFAMQVINVDGFGPVQSKTGKQNLGSKTAKG